MMESGPETASSVCSGLPVTIVMKNALAEEELREATNVSTSDNSTRSRR